MLEATPSQACVVVSVVSHGHGSTVQPLLYALAEGVQLGASSVRRVVLTLNLPEPEPEPPPGGWPFLLQIVRNSLP
ncbi:MAG: glycosyl transferase, partial [Giesbergeria sp.]|nr:glycosyl transferase [Giesbergeria sp.]